MSTSTMTFTEAIARTRAMAVHDAVAHIFTEWNHAHQDPDPRGWTAYITSLSQSEKITLAEVRRNAFDAAFEGARILTTIADMMRGWNLASAEERRFVAEIRCLIDDADHALREGHLTDARRIVLDASKHLNWLLYERKRSGSRTYRLLPAPVVTAMTATLDELDRVVVALGRAA